MDFSVIAMDIVNQAAKTLYVWCKGQVPMTVRCGAGNELVLRPTPHNLRVLVYSRSGVCCKVRRHERTAQVPIRDNNPVIMEYKSEFN